MKKFVDNYSGSVDKAASSYLAGTEAKRGAYKLHLQFCAISASARQNVNNVEHAALL